MTVTLPAKGIRGERRLEALGVFADYLKEVRDTIGFPVSPRGWCYELEDQVPKSQFDLVEGLVNEYRRKGILAVDFTAEEEGRQFSGVETPETESVTDYMRGYLKAVLRCGNWYTPDWWDGEGHYIQMVVEKIDLKSMFEPICRDYHIPIATAKGWSSISMRAEFTKRFKRAEERGLKCVLLYGGDHDPDGLRISEFLRANLDAISDIVWESGESGYDPKDLIIDRFGLDYDFIMKHNLKWVNNLITGSKTDLASPKHHNHNMAYVQDYIREFGARKCEANAILKVKKAGRELCENAIQKYLGPDAKKRFHKKREKVLDEMAAIREEAGLDKAVADALELIE